MHLACCYVCCAMLCCGLQIMYEPVDWVKELTCCVVPYAVVLLLCCAVLCAAPRFVTVTVTVFGTARPCNP